MPSFHRARRHTRDFAALFPSSTSIAIVKPVAAAGAEITAGVQDAFIEPNGDVSPAFRAILDSTNRYLQKNVGAPADFRILQGIAERVSDAAEYEASANATLPLYVGLMG